jgi:hypothetical protein
MKARFCAGGWMVGCGLALFVLLSSAGPIGATVFTYDFENPPLTSGVPIGSYPSAGQDGWISWGAQYAHTRPGTGVDVTRVVDFNNPSGGGGGDWILRNVSPGVQVTGANTQVAARYWLNPGANKSVYCQGGVSFTGSGPDDPWPVFGTDYDGAGNPVTYFRAADRTVSKGNGIGLSIGGENHWYELQLLMDFSDSSAGGRATLGVRDVTLGQTTFTNDPSITNIPMRLTPTGGVYTMNAINFRVGGADVLADHIRFATDVSELPMINSLLPEPNAFALLASGLFGLLAYAWRRRK